MKIQTKYRSNFHKMVNFHEVKCTPPTLPPLARPSKKIKENLHTCPHVHTHKHTHTRTHTHVHTLIQTILIQTTSMVAANSLVTG